jgi:hypothetical protein
MKGGWPHDTADATSSFTIQPLSGGFEGLSYYVVVRRSVEYGHDRERRAT